MSNSKRHFIQLLLTLYPKQWRQEYGDEFSGLLEARRLLPQTVSNVVRSALVQRWRDGEPWFIAGILCMGMNLLGALVCFCLGTPVDFGAMVWGKQALWSSVFSIAVLFIVGFWTALRSNKADSKPGRAAMKTALLSAWFLPVLTVLLLVHAIPVIVVGPNGTGHPFAFVYSQASSAVPISPQFLAWVYFWGCLLNLPVAGVIGFMGGIAGRFTGWAARIGRVRPT